MVNTYIMFSDTSNSGGLFNMKKCAILFKYFYKDIKKIKGNLFYSTKLV